MCSRTYLVEVDLSIGFYCLGNRLDGGSDDLPSALLVRFLWEGEMMVHAMAIFDHMLVTRRKSTPGEKMSPGRE